MTAPTTQQTTPGTRPGSRRATGPTLPARTAGAGRGSALAFFVIGTLGVLLLIAIHLTQGTAAVGPGDLLRYVFGAAGEDATGIASVLSGSRLPRVVTGLVIGVTLGLAGVALQSLSRNPLASPDTLAVNAGAWLMVTVVAAFGISLPVLVGGGVAFIGGLAAAALVVVLGGSGSSTRLVLAGTALTLALASVTAVLQLLFQEQTQGLFAWGSGSLLIIDLDAVRQLLPVLVVVGGALLFTAHRLDVLSLGDDTAASLGIHVGRLRLIVLVLAVLLATTAVALAGPIGFVGLFAPAIARLLGRRIPALARHRLLFPAAGLIGAGTVVGADVVLRSVFGAEAGVNVPTGVVTSVLGAGLLIWIARTSAASRTMAGSGSVVIASRTRFLVALVISVVVAVAAVVVGILVGPRLLLWGDVINWWSDVAGRVVNATMDERLPRVSAAFLAGAALAVAGAVVQAVCRNPLAEPGLLGVSAGAGCGAVLAITAFPAIGLWGMTGMATLGAFGAFALVYLLSRRGGLDSGRVVLIGIGISAGGTALISLMVILSDPWDKIRALTWLSGSTYGRGLDELIPVICCLLILAPLFFSQAHRLDLLALDDDTPRLLGLPLESSRLVLLGGAALLTAASVTAIGVISFVGLVAPHLARALVGARNARVLPVAMLLGGVIVSIGDTLGRTVLAPTQLPAGLVAAIIGAPYFVLLLWRTRD